MKSKPIKVPKVKVSREKCQSPSQAHPLSLGESLTKEERANNISRDRVQDLQVYPHEMQLFNAQCVDWHPNPKHQDLTKMIDPLKKIQSAELKEDPVISSLLGEEKVDPDPNTIFFGEREINYADESVAEEGDEDETD